jgi:2-methylisocitrate lyase-like PEP mutase family enzyme
MDARTQNNLAIKLRSLHRPGSPLVLCNVYDAATASLIVNHPKAQAVATASYAIATTLGVEDNDMTLAENLQGVRNVASVVIAKSNLPLTVDLQDGYTDVGESVRAVIQLGAVGCNLEDVESKVQRLRSVEEAVDRIRRALEAARQAGVPDFAINARTDVMGFNGTVGDVVERGKAYLGAGATTVFVWGGGQGRGLTREEVKRICEALNGRVSVLKRLASGFLTVRELGDLGVARISVGPGLYREAMAAFKQGVDGLFQDQ